MKAWMCGLAMAALPVLGGQPKAAPAPIALYFEFEHDPPKAVWGGLRDELDSIMTPLSLRFEWRNLRGRGDEPAIELAVVSFKGRCDLDGPVLRHGSPGALGWTHISNGVILPFADVDCEGMRNFLQRALRLLSGADRQEAFGRALGRVLAHELYHIFADTTRHGSGGIGKGTYSVQDLLAANFRFGDKESQALLNGKAYGWLETGHDPPD